MYRKDICRLTRASHSEEAHWEVGKKNLETLGHIYVGLMDLDDVVRDQLDEDMSRRCQQLMAVVVTEAFTYMMAYMLECGCVEAFIFLRILEDDCSSVHYALAVPHVDVGPC